MGWKSIKEKDEEMVEEEKRAFEGLEAQNHKTDERSLSILMLTIRIHSEPLRCQ